MLAPLKQSCITRAALLSMFQCSTFASRAHEEDCMHEAIYLGYKCCFMPRVLHKLVSVDSRWSTNRAVAPKLDTLIRAEFNKLDVAHQQFFSPSVETYKQQCHALRPSLGLKTPPSRKRVRTRRIHHLSEVRLKICSELAPQPNTIENGEQRTRLDLAPLGRAERLHHHICCVTKNVSQAGPRIVHVYLRES